MFFPYIANGAPTPWFRLDVTSSLLNNALKFQAPHLGVRFRIGGKEHGFQNGRV